MTSNHRSAGTDAHAPVPAVELRDISVMFGDSVALEDLNLTVNRGECLALLGASGSGKSTALNCIAGFVKPTSGSVILNGQDATALPPAKRNLGFVVQSYALFPHMSVRNNIAFGLRARRMPNAQIRERVEEVAELVGMSDYLERKPSQLSGGQQQRIAIARALAIKPSVLLLDEPTSALDTRLREHMIDELRRLRRDLPDVAVIVVTHDQNEAMALADRIALLKDGRCEAWDGVEKLFHEPPTDYTATFLGSANVIPSRVLSVGEGSAIVRILGVETAIRAPYAITPSDNISVAVRPWQWEVVGPSTEGIDAVVESIQWRGAVHRYRVRVDGVGEVLTVELRDTGSPTPVGDTLRIRPEQDVCVAIDNAPYRKVRGS